MTLTTISGRVFRSTSALGSQGRAPWRSCSQRPAGTALTASLSCRPWPCPGCLLLQQALPHQGVRQSVVAGHKREGECGWAALRYKALGDPHVSWIETHTGKALGCPTFRALCIWQMAEERSTYLSLPLPTEHHLNHQEWTGLQQLRKILVQWQMQFNAGKSRIKIVRQKIPKESQDIRGKCSEAWWLKRDLSVRLGYESLKLMDNCSGKIMLRSELHA